MSFTSRKKKLQNIINEISNEYKEASYWLPFDALEIKEVFTEEELNLLKEFIDEMDTATNENERKAKLINNINKYGDILIKGLKLAKII